MIKKTSFLIAFIWVVNGFGQVNNTSPYSYFGIGDNNKQETVASSSMGGINVSQNYKSELNFSNPAAQSALQFTTFSISVKTKFLNINDGSINQSSSYTGLSSLALGVPIGEKSGFVVGLQPNSTVGYNIIEEILDPDSGEIGESNLFTGNGGTNRFFGSFGYQILKGLSLGIEGEYVFGKINNNIINQRLGVALNSKHKQQSNITGASVRIGSQYSKKIKDDLKVNIGASIKLKNVLNAISDEYFYSFSYGSAGEIPRDTLVYNTNIEGKITQPLSITTGAGIGKDKKWYIAVQYEGQDALSFDESVLQNNNKVQYTTRSKYSLGGFWIPKVNSITSYWQRVVYRAGLKYEKAGIAVNASNDNIGEFTPINDFGISFGLGLPVGNQLSQVNLGLEYGNRGNTNNGLIKENYFNLRLSLNLADKWFRKNKIN